MTQPYRIHLALLAGALAGTFAFAARAQEAPPAQADGAPPKSVHVQARTNPGDLPYGWVFEDQTRLQSYLPAKARMVDFSWRITFTELSEPEQDDYLPQGWAVALVGQGFEKTVPVERGGYFLLPALPIGRQSSTIMFKEQSLQNYIGAAWRVRVGAGQRLSYADFKEALDEVHGVQAAIPVQRTGLKQLRAGHFDSIKACFLGAGGAILVDGQPVADASFGHCSLLKFDPAKAAAGAAIEFKGRLDVVTVVESADYLALPDLPTPNLAAHTNPSDLAYERVYKHQMRLQGYLPMPEHVVDFVWRLSLGGLSEAEQDAWVPQGWAVALAGKSFARAVPVARGGYFLLPALPPGRQDATLVFREQGRQKQVGAAWVVHLRDGQRPYLYYGEFKEALDAVRKAQEAIPEGHVALATLRVGHYDGLKACFRAAGGVVFVGDTPTALATVGNCKVVKFDPAQSSSQTIEFVGPLSAVTMVDTAPYSKAKD